MTHFLGWAHRSYGRHVAIVRSSRISIIELLLGCLWYRKTIPTIVVYLVRPQQPARPHDSKSRSASVPWVSIILVCDEYRPQQPARPHDSKSRSASVLWVSISLVCDEYYRPASVAWAHITHLPTMRSTNQLCAIPAMWMKHNLHWAYAF